MPNHPDLQWTLANPSGILINEEVDAWHTGIVTDIQRLDTGELLVASATGGVWTVNLDGTTICWSNDWPIPDVHCLARGPDGVHHFFAGCSDGSIRETDQSLAMPMLSWKVTVDHHTSFGKIFAIEIIRNLRRIIVACESGIYWATIPDSSIRKGCLPVARKPATRKYEWKKAKIESGSDLGFWDIAFGSTTNTLKRSDLEKLKNITVVAGAFYNGAEPGGVYVGSWGSSGDLVMKRPGMQYDNSIDYTGNFFSLTGTTSVASCETRPTTFYAACSWKDGRLYVVLKSDDGGYTWTKCGERISGSEESLNSMSGDNGTRYTNCIAVMPTNSGVVAVGWVPLFLSLNWGKDWQIVQKDNHSHADNHSLHFYEDGPGSRGSLYVGSDGGVMRIGLDDYFAGIDTAFQTSFNRFLPILQCYSTTGMRGFYGSLGVSRTMNRLIAVGLQDNGNIYGSSLLPSQPWRKTEGGDGGINTFISTGAVLHYMGGQPDPTPTIVTSFANSAGSFSVDSSSIPQIEHPTLSGPLNNPLCEYVLMPNYTNSKGQLLQAVAGLGSKIYGLYSDRDNLDLLHWELILTLPGEEIPSGIATYDGHKIYVGTSKGTMFTIDPGTAMATLCNVILPKPNPTAKMTTGTVTSIVCFMDGIVFAVMNGAIAESFDASGISLSQIPSNYILRLVGASWLPTLWGGFATKYIYAIEGVSIRNSAFNLVLFAVTDDEVFISVDGGDNFHAVTHGLPRNPHCSDLRFASIQGEANLYLSTGGRSVWVARLQ